MKKTRHCACIFRGGHGERVGDAAFQGVVHSVQVHQELAIPQCRKAPSLKGRQRFGLRGKCTLPLRDRMSSSSQKLNYLACCVKVLL